MQLGHIQTKQQPLLLLDLESVGTQPWTRFHENINTHLCLSSRSVNNQVWISQSQTNSQQEVMTLRQVNNCSILFFTTFQPLTLPVQG